MNDDSVRAGRMEFDDHYYWLTSLVASHNLERVTCRAVAAIAFLLGIIPLLLVIDAPGQHSGLRLAVAGAVAGICTTIAVLWATRYWPTRAQSRVCAVAGTIAVAAAAYVIPDPLLATLGCLAFAAPAGFSALFHSRRELILTWAVGGATLVMATLRLVQAAPLLALPVVPVVILINLFAAYAWQLVVQLTEAKVASAHLDPLTGLLNRTAFEEEMSIVLGARGRQHDRHLVIVVIAIDTYDLLMSMGQPAGADDACVLAARQLRATVRRDTILAHRGGGEFLIAEVFTAADPAPLLERVRGTLTDRPAQLSASIGAVSTPLPPLASYSAIEVLDELLPLANQARNDARREGGNSSRCLIDPTLRFLENPHDHR